MSIKKLSLDDYIVLALTVGCPALVVLLQIFEVGFSADGLIGATFDNAKLGKDAAFLNEHYHGLFTDFHTRLMINSNAIFSITLVAALVLRLSLLGRASVDALFDRKHFLRFEERYSFFNHMGIILVAAVAYWMAFHQPTRFCVPDEYCSRFRVQSGLKDTIFQIIFLNGFVLATYFVVLFPIALFIRRKRGQ